MLIWRIVRLTQNRLGSLPGGGLVEPFSTYVMHAKHGIMLGRDRQAILDGIRWDESYVLRYAYFISAESVGYISMKPS